VSISHVQGVKVQIRVIRALMLRETKTLFGKYKLGYLWAFIQASFMIFVFWVLRNRPDIQPPYGIKAAHFLVAGFIPWFIFSESVSRSMQAIKANKALLSYPQVFPLDLIIARTLLVAATYICVLGSILALLIFSNIGVDLARPELILLGLASSVVLGLGMGAVCSSLSLIIPSTERVVPMLLRVLFFTSGLFFSVTSLPLSYQNILFYNPISHIIEMIRSGFSSSYPVRFISLPYLSFFLLLAIGLGLILERLSRRHIDRDI